MGTKHASTRKRAGMAGDGPDAGRGADTRPESPLYQQIARTLREEIVSGAYPVGSLLPTEDRLCERFSVSRYTIREALRRLREDGLVSSKQGAGTLVIPPSASGKEMHQVMSINDLLAWATDSRLEIATTRMITIDGKLAALAGLPRGEEWLEVCGRRQSRADGTPECWTQYYIHRDFAAVGRLLQRHSGPIFPLIEDMFGQNIVEVQQQISATLLDVTLADALGVEIGSAALEVRRTYKSSEGRVVQVTINVHPASRYKHSITMRRVKP